MADEAVNAPIAADTAGTSDVAPVASESKPSAADSREQGGFSGLMNRLLGRPVETDEHPVSDDIAEESQTPAADAAPQAPPPITLTQEELDRRVQSEADRREAKRAADQRRQQQAHAAQQAEEERRRLLAEDPFTAAELELERIKQTEAANQEAAKVGEVLGNAATMFDRALLDPIYNALPQSERTRIFGDGPVGIDGRAKAVTEGLKALEAHFKKQGAAEAEKKLRADPAFIKRVYQERRFGANAVTEPDLAPAAASGANGSGQGGDWIRALVASD